MTDLTMFRDVVPLVASFMDKLINLVFSEEGAPLGTCSQGVHLSFSSDVGRSDVQFMSTSTFR
jgi:hypothetical protein